jgi:hypothetical protein
LFDLQVRYTLYANGIPQSISFAWNASTDNSGNFSYHVTESSGFNTYTVAVPQTRTTLTFTRLRPEQTYTYTVRAVDAAGNRSGDSNTVSYTVPADVTPPAPAPQLTVTPFRPARAGFSWTRSVDNVSQAAFGHDESPPRCLHQRQR